MQVLQINNVVIQFTYMSIHRVASMPGWKIERDETHSSILHLRFIREDLSVNFFELFDKPIDTGHMYSLLYRTRCIVSCITTPDQGPTPKQSEPGKKLFLPMNVNNDHVIEQERPRIAQTVYTKPELLVAAVDYVRGDVGRILEREELEGFYENLQLCQTPDVITNQMDLLLQRAHQKNALDVCEAVQDGILQNLEDVLVIDWEPGLIVLMCDHEYVHRRVRSSADDTTPFNAYYSWHLDNVGRESIQMLYRPYGSHPDLWKTGVVLNETGELPSEDT